jgi:hypothetical protein
MKCSVQIKCSVDAFAAIKLSISGAAATAESGFVIACHCPLCTGLADY